jgi:hypothetical protein
LIARFSYDLRLLSLKSCSCIDLFLMVAK